MNYKHGAKSPGMAKGNKPHGVGSKSAPLGVVKAPKSKDLAKKGSG